MKRFLVVMLAVGMLLLCACGNGNTESISKDSSNTPNKSIMDNQSVNNGKTIYFNNCKNWNQVRVQYFNTETPTDIKYKDMNYLETNEAQEKIYTCDIDISMYNRVQFSNGDDIVTMAVPVTKYSSCYVPDSGSDNRPITSYYEYGEDPDRDVVTTTVNLPYDNDVGNKDIYIWTPEGYNPNDTDTKYSVLYMSDGQGVFQYTPGEWAVAMAESCVLANGGNGIIIVGIDDSDYHRDSELTPDLGDTAPGYEQEFGERTGDVYCSFVTDTVMPYINENYNTYTDKEHTGFCGSSSGGIEAFYIGMENLDKFDYIGAFSPAFMIFDTPTWRNYLSSLDFTVNQPNIYIYNGYGDSMEKEMYNSAMSMPSILQSYGYSQNKFTVVECPEGTHNETYWNSFFPEFIAMMG